MTVTPFVPALSTGPATSGRAARSDGAGKDSSTDSESPTGEQTVDDFLATLSTALAAVAPTPPDPTRSASAAPSTLAGGLAGTAGGAAPTSGVSSTVRGVPTVDGSPPAGAVPAGGASSTVATVQTVDSSPLLAAPPVGGEQSTVGSPQTVDSSPLAAAGGRTAASALPAPTTTGAATAAAIAATTATTTATTTPATTPAAASTDSGEQSTVGTRPTVDDAPLPVTALDASSGASVSVTGSGVVDHEPRTTGARTTAVLRQVFPEVTRVAAQAGPGTHRLSITLHPETLGEVKVTLVVRAGAVHVNLATATGAAHDALLQGAPELHRLLEATGGDARVVVRDGSTSTTTDQRGADARGQQPSYTPAGDGHDGHDAPDGRGAGDGRAAGDPRRGDRTTPGPSVGEAASAPGSRPGSPTGAGQNRTAVHPGRLDRLM